MKLIGKKAGGVAFACHVFFPPTHAGGTTSASLPAGKPVASLRHSFPLLLELYVFEEQHWSHLPEPACQSGWQQSPSGPAGTVIPDASARLLCRVCFCSTLYTRCSPKGSPARDVHFTPALLLQDYSLAL